MAKSLAVFAITLAALNVLSHGLIVLLDSSPSIGFIAIVISVAIIAAIKQFNRTAQRRLTRSEAVMMGLGCLAIALVFDALILGIRPQALMFSLFVNAIIIALSIVLLIHPVQRRSPDRASPQ